MYARHLLLTAERAIPFYHSLQSDRSATLSALENRRDGVFFISGEIR